MNMQTEEFVSKMMKSDLDLFYQMTGTKGSEPMDTISMETIAKIVSIIPGKAYNTQELHEAVFMKAVNDKVSDVRLVPYSLLEPVDYQRYSFMQKSARKAVGMLNSVFGIPLMNPSPSPLEPPIPTPEQGDADMVGEEVEPVAEPEPEAYDLPEPEPEA